MPEEIIKQQKADAAAAKATKKARSIVPISASHIDGGTIEYPDVPAKAAASMPAAMPQDTRSDIEKYLDTVSPSGVAGELVKFDGKEGKFLIAESGEEISPDRDFIALCDEVLVGWIRFNGDDAPPTRDVGLLYRGFIPKPRAVLGDMNERDWPEGRFGVEDPWKATQALVLQDPATGSLFTFTTLSPTGRSGVTALLRHYDRLRRDDPNVYPTVKLKPGGYPSKKYGWIHKPVFCVTGKTTKSSLTPPDTSPGADMDDGIPF